MDWVSFEKRLNAGETIWVRDVIPEYQGTWEELSYTIRPPLEDIWDYLALVLDRPDSPSILLKTLDQIFPQGRITPAVTSWTEVGFKLVRTRFSSVAAREFLSELARTPEIREIEDRMAGITDPNRLFELCLQVAYQKDIKQILMKGK